MNQPKLMGTGSALKWIFSMSKGYRNWFLLSIISAGMLICINLFRAYYIQELINTSLKSDIDKLVQIVLMVAIIILFGFLLSYLVKYFTGKFAIYVIRELKNRQAEHLTRVSFQNIGEVQSGDLSSRLNNDTKMVHNLLKNVLPNFTLHVLTGLAAAIYVFFISWKLLLVSLLFTPFGMYLASYLNKNAGKYYPESFKYLGEAAGEVEQSIIGIDIIKSYNLTNLFSKKVQEKYKNVYNAEMNVQKYVSGLQPVCYALSYFPRLVCVIYGGYMALNGQIEAGTIILVLQLFEYIVAPTVYAPFMLNHINRAVAALNRVAEVLTYPEERVDGDNISKVKSDPTICFEHVSFGYKDSGKIFTDLNFKLNESQITALVGASGSGKSTIINLICGLVEHDGGKIEIFGQESKNINLPSLRDQITVVSQDTYLFPATIAENLMFGCSVARMEDMIEAAKAANAHEFIEELPNGYQTLVGEGGSNLSGGQRQRLAIARAFLKNSPILILDEPTASLDNYSETLIKKSIEKLFKGRTVFVIAHRLSTIQQADQILVLQDGKIVENGTHEELIKCQGIYHRLYHSQLSA